MQEFKLVAIPLRRKMEARGNRSFHHGKTHETIDFEVFYDFFNLLRNNKAYVNSLINNQQSKSIEEIKGPASSVGGEVEKNITSRGSKFTPK